MQRIVFLQLSLIASVCPVFLAAGCTSNSTPGLVAVAGTIMVDGKPGESVAVEFRPLGNTKGNGGTALTDRTGKYTIETPQGEKGLLPGDYRVILNRRRGRDGSIPDPGVPPIEAQAAETLPARYSDPEYSELKASVSRADQSHDFQVQTGKKK